MLTVSGRQPAVNKNMKVQRTAWEGQWRHGAGEEGCNGQGGLNLNGDNNRICVWVFVMLCVLSWVSIYECFCFGIMYAWACIWVCVYGGCRCVCAFQCESGHSLEIRDLEQDKLTGKWKKFDFKYFCFANDRFSMYYRPIWAKSHLTKDICIENIYNKSHPLPL